MREPGAPYPHTALSVSPSSVKAGRYADGDKFATSLLPAELAWYATGSLAHERRL
jgi:hypothetical protein